METGEGHKEVMLPNPDQTYFVYFTGMVNPFMIEPWVEPTKKLLTEMGLPANHIIRPSILHPLGNTVAEAKQWLKSTHGQLRNNSKSKIIIAGHSSGALAAMELARVLHYAKTPMEIDLLLFCVGTDFNAFIGPYKIPVAGALLRMMENMGKYYDKDGKYKEGHLSQVKSACKSISLFAAGNDGIIPLSQTLDTANKLQAPIYFLPEQNHDLSQPERYIGLVKKILIQIL